MSFLKKNYRICLPIISAGILLFWGTMMKGDEMMEVMKVRPMAVAGQFYPAEKADLLANLKSCFSRTKVRFPDGKIQSVIVPHAGYVFSGPVAAEAFRQIDPRTHYEHIFLIGPSHHIGMDGASVCNAYAYYETPLGRVQVDTALASHLIASSSVFRYVPQAHDREHCLEVQLPFLQYHLHEVPPIVPIIIGTQDLQRIREMAVALQPYFNSRNLFVISSDFSHYPSFADASRVDARTGGAVATGSLEKFVDVLVQNDSLGIPQLATSACGQCAIALLLMLSDHRPGMKIHQLIYRNSGDSPYGEKKEVVGYFAFCQTVPNLSHPQSPVVKEFLTREEKQNLLALARACIFPHSQPPVQVLSSLKTRKCGAFVTLTENGELRGCIGHFGADRSLAETVAETAKAAAFEDPRFQPVKASEYTQVQIEISVLTPLKRISSIDEFAYGQQGIYMRKGVRSGTFLPQVAQEVNWSKEEFLGHCAQDKAGIGWDGWRTAELYTYEAIVFSESSMGMTSGIGEEQ